MTKKRKKLRWFVGCYTEWRCSPGLVWPELPAWWLPASPFGEQPNFQHVSAVLSLVYVKATEVALVFHLAVAGCPLACSLVPPGVRRAAVNAVQSFFLSAFLILSMPKE